MKDEDFYIEKLQKHGIKPTAIRLLVLRQLFRNDEMLSLPDLINLLKTVDKSTLSRTLSLFLKQNLIHSISDGMGATKYALCDDDVRSTPQEDHVHFCCVSCQRTFCLKNIHAPAVHLPSGFIVKDFNYIIKGLCPECNHKNG